METVQIEHVKFRKCTISTTKGVIFEKMHLFQFIEKCKTNYYGWFKMLVRKLHVSFRMLYGGEEHNFLN